MGIKIKPGNHYVMKSKLNISGDTDISNVGNDEIKTTHFTLIRVANNMKLSNSSCHTRAVYLIRNKTGFIYKIVY